MRDDIAYLVLSVVNEIPKGKVSSYVQIAKACGYPKNARLVGKILSQADFWGKYPCHRVIHADGSLVKGWDEQKSILEEEGITFLKNEKVNIKKHIWELN